MNNKKSLTLSILNNIGKEKIIKRNNIKKDSNEEKNKNKEVKLDLNSFIMVPTNHPMIKEILDILNDKFIKDLIKPKDNNTKVVITLNEIIDNLNENKINIPENAIITPLARDYIKEKNIEVITTYKK